MSSVSAAALPVSRAVEIKIILQINCVKGQKQRESEVWWLRDTVSRTVRLIQADSVLGPTVQYQYSLGLQPLIK